MRGFSLALALALFWLPVRPALAVQQTGVPLQSARSSGCSEILANGGFEDGSAAWSTASNNDVNLISPFKPRTGSLGAYLADRNGADDRVSQVVTLPASRLATRLRFWWALSTDEPPLAGTRDTLTVAIYRPGGTLLADLIIPPLDNTAPVNVWQQAEVDLTTFAGQTVELRFQAVTDSMFRTAFFVDDASITSCQAVAWSYLPVLMVTSE